MYLSFVRITRDGMLGHQGHQGSRETVPMKTVLVKNCPDFQDQLYMLEYFQYKNTCS